MKNVTATSKHMMGFLLVLTLALGGCGDSSNSDSCGAFTGTNIAFVLTTDFSTGSYSTVDLDTLTAANDLAAAEGTVESDNTGAFYNDRIYVINRGTPSNITVLDKDSPCQALNQFSTGNGTNPYAMAFNSDTEAYVLLYGSNEIAIVDPTATSDQITGTIDLSGFMAAGDTDENVEAAAMVKANDYLFVVLQRLDNFAATNDALLVVIDTTTNEVVDVNDETTEVDAISLTGRNPQYIVYNETAGKLYVSETGGYGANDGGIEAVDPVTWEAEGFVITETALGGDVGAVVMVDGTQGYAVVGGFSANRVVSFNATNGTATADLVTDTTFIPSLTLDDQGRLFVPARTTTSPGIQIFDTSDDSEITTTPIDVGLPPNVILVY